MAIRYDIQFVFSESPITEIATKFGGQPTWVDVPQWPLSRETGNPMRFICQVALDKRLFPHSTGTMAYVFMTDEDDFVDGTWEPNGGENSVIIQPSHLAPGVPTSAIATGPTLYDMVEVAGRDRLVQVEREYAVKLSLNDEPPYQIEQVRSLWTDDEFEKYAQGLDGNKVGGVPIFLQGDEFPEGGEWNLLLQLDSTNVPFSVNFGDAGIAYVFIDPAGQIGKMLWQCA